MTSLYLDYARPKLHAAIPNVTGDFSQPFVIPHCIIMLHIWPRGMEITPPVESPLSSWCIIRSTSLFAATHTQLCGACVCLNVLSFYPDV